MKKWIWWLIAAALIIAAIVCVIIYVKEASVWNVLLNIASFVGGAVIGWLAKIFYDRYIKD